MAKYKILSMDGASLFDGLGYVTPALLERVDSTLRKAGRRGHFLDRVDLFAGTSSGGWTAMYLAMQKQPSDALKPRRRAGRAKLLVFQKTLAEFWRDAAESMAPSQTMTPERTIMALCGVSALMSVDSGRELLIKYFGEHTTLRDLNRHVLITTFQLDNPKETHRRWKQKIFHNFGKDNPRSTETDLDEKVVDVAMRTGAAPLVGPIVHGLSGQGPGYVDGGVFANNPALCALAQALKVRSGVEKALRPEDVSLISVGNGSVPVHIEATMHRGIADWGYLPWMLDPSRLGLFLHMVMEAGMDAVEYQADRILGPKNFLRLQPECPKPLIAYSAQGVLENVRCVQDLYLKFPESALTFAGGDFQEARSFALKLHQRSEPVSQFLWDCLLAPARRRISASVRSRAKDKKLAAVLAQNLNRIIQTGPIYAPDRFLRVQLSAEAQFLLRADTPRSPLQGDRRLRLNRLLIQEAYSREIAPSPTSMEAESLDWFGRTRWFDAPD